MSGALNSRSTTAGRVGIAGGLPPASCARAILDVAIPATNADAVPMNSRRLMFIRSPISFTNSLSHHLGEAKTRPRNHETTKPRNHERHEIKILFRAFVVS